MTQQRPAEVNEAVTYSTREDAVKKRKVTLPTEEQPWSDTTLSQPMSCRY